MSAAQTGGRGCGGTLTTTGFEYVTLTKTAREVVVTNGHASNNMWVNLNTRSGGTPTTLTAAADEAFMIPPLTSRVILKSAAPVYVNVGLVGNANPYYVEGHDWYT